MVNSLQILELIKSSNVLNKVFCFSSSPCQAYFTSVKVYHFVFLACKFFWNSQRFILLSAAGIKTVYGKLYSCECDVFEEVSQSLVC